jgi:hypothetical protein
MRTVMLALGATLAVCGCSKDQSPTSPSTTTAATPTTILFSGTLAPRATRFYSYSMTTAGSVSAMLASLERNGAPTSNALEIGLGIPAGTSCSVSAALNSSSQLTPQLRQDFGIGTYCVRISDIDGLPASMTFTIRVIHP